MVIIFDVDGTLYPFKNGSLMGSGLYDAILSNTKKYLIEKLGMQQDSAERALQNILSEYGTGLSIGMEKLHGVDRCEYFNCAWDLPVGQFLTYNPAVHATLLDLAKHHKVVILSDAPRVWIRKVLSELKLDEVFQDSLIFSGEGDIRKEHGNAFGNMLTVLSAEASSCVSFGDQEHTDIIPAKRLGIKTVFVGKQKSKVADASIENITKCQEVIKLLLG